MVEAMVVMVMMAVTVTVADSVLALVLFEWV